jgi:glucan phosphoethanolaminetransferase (alkaline phosphatase superfamily)
MRKIFIGMLFVFLDFTLTLNTSRIELIPDFIGYILMVQGLMELADESLWFGKVRPYAIGMAIYSGVLYVFDLFGTTDSTGVLSWVFGLISTGISLYISYGIVMGVQDIESMQNRNLDGSELMAKWKLYAILSAIIYLLVFIPVLNVLAIIAGFVIAVYFLIAFHRTSKLYEQT